MLETGDTTKPIFSLSVNSVIAGRADSLQSRKVAAQRKKEAEREKIETREAKREL